MSTSVFLLMRGYDYEGSRVMSVWTSLAAAEAELLRIRDPDDHFSNWTIDEFRLDTPYGWVES